MGRSKHLVPLVLLTASSLAHAQCRLCAQPTTSIPPAGKSVSRDVDLQIESNLTFDRFILNGPGSGAVTIRADGSTGVEGAVLQAGSRAMVGTILVHGDANRTLRVDIPRRIQLFSLAGGRITLDDISSDLPPTPKLDAAGNLSFHFGGRLIVTGNLDGPFRGDVSVTAEYQ